MRNLLATLCLLLLPALALAHDPLNTDPNKTQTIYINTDMSAEVLRAYNEQAALISEMRLKLQELEHQLFQTTERLTNLEAEVWDMSESRKKSTN